MPDNQNKSKSKSGFTLIELIVSIAILAILYPAISAAFLNAQALMAAENSKLDTMSNAQLIMQELQVEGRDKIESIRSNYAVEETQALSVYIFYNTDADLNMDALITTRPDNVVKITDGKLGNPQGALNEMSALGKDYPYAANVFILWDQDTGEHKYYKIYKAKVTTWDLNHQQVESNRTAYIGE